MNEKWTFVGRQESPSSWLGCTDYISADGKMVKRVWDDGEIEYYKTA